MNRSTKLNPGAYYIGDPCNLKPEIWDELLEKNDALAGIHRTAMGDLAIMDRDSDGTYEDSRGRLYYTSTATLCVAPKEAVKQLPAGSWGHRIITIEEVSPLVIMKNGMILLTVDNKYKLKIGLETDE